jgi:serine/threonine-protein kinase
MSPEQAMGERTIDARSDIYALGAVTYEMLTGDPPFTGSSVQAIVAKVMTERPTPPHAIRDTVPVAVEGAVLTALAKLPADRFATTAEFAMALHEGATNVRGTRASRRAAAPASASRIRAAAVAAALLVGGAMLGLFASRLWRSAPSGAAVVTATSILPPPGGTFGEQRALALSPDGRRLAFVLAEPDGSRSLWVRALDRLDAEPVPHSTGADAPFWSPNGQSLGYFAGGSLVVLDQNGETRNVCPVTSPTGGSWSSSGMILFGDRVGLSTVSVAGGACKVIFPRDSGPPLKGLFLPDGKHLLVSRGNQLDMVAANLDGKVFATLPVRTLEFAVVAPGYLITSSRADAVAIDAQRINLTSLTLEGPVARVASDVRSQAGIQTFTASANGALAFLPGGVDRPYLVYDANGLLRDTVRVNGTWSLEVRPSHGGPATVALAGNTVGIWLYDLDANRAVRIPVHDSAFPTTGYKFGTTYPVFSPDGEHLVYSMFGPGRCRIVDRDLGTNVERVVGQEVASHGDKNECRYPLDWSPDGRSLLVRQDSTLRIVPVDGKSGEQVIVRPGRVLEGRFSPDGRSIAYTSEETGRAEVYVQTLPSGLPVQVSRDGGRWAGWSRGGRQLTFMTPDGRVQAAEISSSGAPAGVPRTLFSIPTWRRSMFDDNGTGFAVVGDGERYLVRQSATGLAVAYLQQWPMLFHGVESSASAVAKP